MTTMSSSNPPKAISCLESYTYCTCPLLKRDGIEAALSLRSCGGVGGRVLSFRRRPRAVAAPEAQPQQAREPCNALLCTLVDSIDERFLTAQVRLVRGTLFHFLLLLHLLGRLHLTRPTNDRLQSVLLTNFTRAIKYTYRKKQEDF